MKAKKFFKLIFFVEHLSTNTFLCHLSRRHLITYLKSFTLSQFFNSSVYLRLCCFFFFHYRRSEFLGCMSFPLLTLLHQEINGSYKLQSQECVNKPQPAIPLIAAHHFYGNILQHQQQYQQQQQQQQLSDQQQQLPLNQNRITAKATRITCSINMANTFTQMRSNDDDVISIDSMAQPLAVGEQQAPMVLSKKALHQRDADENLFLRFLELDPPNSTEAATAGQATPAASDRRSSGSKPVGRTPFTMTKKLTRTAERGFGFSIVWTHPPRVEKIEAGLSADRSGILPGDYVIFVDKHNVVTMPEADVLNLIRSQGATLTLEIFRRSGSGTAIGSAMGGGAASAAGTSRSYATNTLPMNGKMSRIPSANSNYAASEEMCINANNVTKRTIVAPAAAQPASVARPPTACSMGTSSSIEAAKRRLNLPQVTFSKESIAPISDNRRKFLLQLISREQNFMSALHFGMQRFVQPLQERKDLITPNDHRTLFQNIDELLRISEDILEQLCHDDQEPQMNFASRVYLSKTTAICAAYKKYCNGIKRADCVLVNKSRQTGSEFISFITEPPVPRKRPDLTMFIHRPLQHFREILKLMQLLASNCHVDTEEHKNFTTVISELQAAYREITVSSGLMEPLGEGRPLLTLQDLESRMVFTKCKPFTLAVQGRQWIFGGDLSRVEGRSVKPYWTLLFSDIIVFAKVSRDRVLFITEEPIPIANIVDSCFHMRKKTTEFRLTVDPNGRLAESPTGYCAPDLTKTPKKGARRKSLILRAPSLELKAVWQNLLQRQIFLVNAALGSTPLSSPLDSPDVLNTLVPLSDIGVASASIGSIKLSSMDSINIRNQHQQQQQQHQQVRLQRDSSKLLHGSDVSGSFENLQRLASTLASRCSTRMTQTTQASVSCSSQTNSPASYRRSMGGVGNVACLGIPGDSVTSLRSFSCGRRHLFNPQTLEGRPLSAARSYNASNNNSTNLLSCSGSSLNTQTLGSGDHVPSCKCLTSIPEASIETGNDSNYELKALLLRQNCSDNSSSEERVLLIDSEGRCCLTSASLFTFKQTDNNNLTTNLTLTENSQKSSQKKLLEFSLSSVGRSFIDESDVLQDSMIHSLATPETPTPNISPSVTKLTFKTHDLDTFSNDFVPQSPTNSAKEKNLHANATTPTIPLAQFEIILRVNYSNRLSNVSEQIEKLIDEKCRFLNKTGTAKSSALHLANWMKGQLDKQQEQARLAAARSPETLGPEDEHILYTDSDQDERITYWTRQQLEKRTKELNLVKENGYIHAKTNGLGKRLSGVEEISMSDNFSEGVSQSHSTTSDSQQITVRSSPIVLDKLAVCRHCHKNCQQNQNSSPSAVEKSGVGQTQPSSPPPPCTKSIKTNLEDSSNTTGLISNSLKVQHSQSSPNRCCKINGSGSRASSVTSISSSTVTGEHPSERSSSKLIASSSKRETGDTESDVAQLISDDVYQSEATDEGALASSISGSSGVEEVRKLITHNIHKLRILDEHNEANVLLNGHYLGSGGGDECTRNEKQQMEEEAAKLASPKRFRITPQVAKEVDENNELADQEVLTTVTVTEMATVVKNEPSSQTPKSPSKPQTPKPVKSPSKLSHSSDSPCKQFLPCNCPCRPADFANTTLSPDELEHETCKLLESPRKSPVLTSNKQEDKLDELYENIHKNCKCICGGEESEKIDPKEEENVDNHAIKGDSDEEEDLSLMLIGLAQLTPAAKLLNMKTPTAPMPTPTTTSSCYIENGFVPTIAVVPPTPDSVLTKTSTNVWDNSGTHMSVTTSTATNLLISNVPRQAIIENIPEDSCDESPLDEEPPYRPMNTTLRRYGTMSSLERLPSEDRLEPSENMAEYQDDNEEDDDDDEELMDKARADNIELDNEIRVVTKALYNHRDNDDDDDDGDDDIDEEADELLSGAKSNGAAWASRASTFVAGKMSFFEESRAFIDKYLGRWNQDHSSSSIQNNNSETDEQMDECTSGATSGEEVWGTPTSGGDNDELHLANSENTHSSPTKSSNSLNDDDDTELMMDELLMAPPMTASTIRGLLPRRRLEPLFEEETESDEEKTQQESEELKKGETTTNGHYLEDSEAGSSSDEDAANEADYDEEDEEDLTSTEDRLQPNLQTTILGPRPLRNPTVEHSLPSTVLKASSCEYLLEPRAPKPLITSAPINSNDLATAYNSETVTPIISSMTLTMTMTTTSTTDKDVSMKVTAATTQSLVHSQTSTTISNVNVTIKQEKDDCYSRIEEVAKNKTTSRPAKFIPPPPPPRRLLLTRTNLKTGGAYTATTKAVSVVFFQFIYLFTLSKIIYISQPLPPVRSGVSADNGYLAGADESVDPTVGIMNVTPAPKMTPRKSQRLDVCNIKTSEENTEVTKVRPSSTIIETSLLGMVEKKPISTSSTTVSMTNEKGKVPQPKPRQTKQPTQATDISNRGDERTTKSPCALAGVGSGLSPRLEMRLALNHDILGDEDLICYDPGPDLTTILGHDLSTFHRLTGRDLLNRSATNRVQPKEAVISYSQQRNSKMDTPTVNRRTRTSLQLQQQTLTTAVSATPFVGSARVGGVPQHLQPNRNTWSNSASAVPSRDGNANVAANCKDYSYSSDENKLSDLEILARREKIYCMSQLKSGSLARTGTATTTMTTSMTATMKSNNLSSSSQALAMMTMTTTTTEDVNEGASQRTRKLVRDETALMDFSKANKLFNFIKRRNSELSSSANCSQISLNDSNANSTPVHRGSPVSPRKDNDKPSLNRRLWKHLTKRRRANSVSEIAAS
uniref:DH domain-containing protein n=1 Tax=Glossina pallidipes TaxID=7398 RepID=A0A1B0A1A7_GLOPL